MTSLVLGAGGILGQHLHQQRPDELFVRRHPWSQLDADLADKNELQALLEAHRPTVIINLAGENRVDNVESGVFDDPVYRINVGLPTWLTHWCETHECHLVQVSTQGVFSGQNPPYGPESVPHPITAYGFQKLYAERVVRTGRSWTIARVTFVLGLRLSPMGRVNPLEQMFELPEQRQVNDRFFSASFAPDVAADLWYLADARPKGKVVHLGTPERTCRYEIAKLANPSARIDPVSDNDFPGPRRPLDTTWASGCLYRDSLAEGIGRARTDWEKSRG